MVRKKLTAREGRGWLSGTLFCTHFRVAFVPQDSPKPDVSLSEHLYCSKCIFCHIVNTTYAVIICIIVDTVSIIYITENVTFKGLYGQNY